MNIEYRGIENKNYIMVSNEKGQIRAREYNDNVPAILSLENEIEQLEKLKLEQIKIKEKYAKKLNTYKHGKFSKLKNFLIDFGIAEATIIAGCLLLPWLFNYVTGGASVIDFNILLIQVSIGLPASAVALLISIKDTMRNYNCYTNQKLQFTTAQEMVYEIDEKIKKKQEKIKQLEEIETYTNYNVPLESTKVSYNNNEIKELEILKITLLNYKQYLKYYEKGKLKNKLQKIYFEVDANLINNAFQKIYQLNKYDKRQF